MAMASARALPVSAYSRQPAGDRLTDSPQGAVTTPAAFGRALTVHHGSVTHDCRPSGLASVQALPTELLCLIFHYLPVSDHVACALVCRRWYDHLPDTRMRLASWLDNRTLRAPFQLSQNAARIHDELLRPWQARMSRPCRLAVERQYQELLRLQDLLHRSAGHEPARLVQQRVRRAGFVLAVLERCTLDHQLSQMPVLAWRSMAIPYWAETDHACRVAFSPCGLWLAMAYGSGTQAGHTGLRIYGRTQGGGWQQETLCAFMTASVGDQMDFAFSKRGAGRLLVLQGADLVVWSRSAEPGHWSPERLYTVSSGCSVHSIMLMDKGDLVLMCDRNQDGVGRQIVFFSYSAQKPGWAEPVVHQYTRWAAASCCNQETNELALGFVKPGHKAACRNIIHIWRPDPARAGSRPWCCQKSYLAPSTARLRHILLSPDGVHLLGLMTNRQLFLWRVHPQYGLDEQLSTVCCMNPMEGELFNLVSFRRDGGQLAVLESPGEIQLWNRAASGKWWPADRVQLHDDADDADDPLCRLWLPGDGRTLVCVYKHRVSVWCKDRRHQWQRQLERINVRPRAPAARAWPVGECRLIVTLAADPALTLCIHSADAAGRLIEKARQTVPAPPFCRSPDGLSLLLGFRNGPPPITLQLVPPAVAPPHGSRDEPHQPEQPG